MNRKKGRVDSDNRRRDDARGVERALLNRLLSELNQYPERVSGITAKLREVLERRVAMLVLDMVGFSRLTLEHGIIHYLAMIHQMVESATPAVIANGGRVIKQDADNIFAIFDNPTLALEAARDIFRAFDAVNTVTPIERHLCGSVGIGYGETLVIDDSDLFGSEMNLASKLGEDLAGKSDILLTASAYEALPAGRYLFAPVRFLIGEMEVDYFRYERALFENSGEPGTGLIKTDAMD
ncbi:MAG: adenylate/guanylate cyclase domain-containing protein [Acidobacteriota bacterium]